ncbi:MAG: serine hydrolase [Bacteroidota bacterium]
MLVRSVLLLVSLLTIPVAVSQTVTDPEATVQQLFAHRAGDDTPGALVAVVQDGEIVHQEAFGMANLTHGIPYTLDTRTNIGSTSKQFTAFAIGLLAERGELRLDDDVRDHIPELPDFGETVTLRHLLTHTSGYREFLNTLLVEGRRLDEGDYIDREEILRVVQRQPELQNTPNTEWNYNNTGYALLTEVVRRVTDQSFPEWMAENVFAPLGMDDTFVRSGPGAIIPNSAQGYEATDSGWREVRDLGAGTSMGAGGIYTTVGDLATWMTTLQTRAFSGAVIDQMTTPHELATGEMTEYGLGLFIDEMSGQPRIHHGGADAAHRSMFAFFPDLNAGVIVLTNSEADAGGLAGKTIRAFFGEAFGESASDPTTPIASSTVDFVPETFDAYAGSYALEVAPDFVLTFRRDGDRYLILPSGQAESEVFPTSDSTFASRIVEASVTFHRDADGEVRSLTLHQNGHHRATRVDAESEADASSMDLSPYAGRYFSDELETLYTLTVEDGELVATHIRTGSETLQHTDGDTFSAGMITVEFVRDASGAVGAFTVDIGRSRGIRFERFDS